MTYQPLTAADIPAPSPAFVGALQQVLDTTPGVTLLGANEGEAFDITGVVAQNLATLLGGFIIDPQVIGHNDGCTVGEQPGREVFIAGEFPDGDNMMTLADGSGILRDPNDPNYRPGWRVIG